MACLAFAAEVGGDFAPGFGVPFQEGVGDAVCGEPCVGTGEYLHEAGVGGVGHDFGVAVAAAYPAEGRAGVGVNGGCGVAGTRQKGRHVDDGEVFADVVGASVEGSDTEKLDTVGHPHAAVLHRSGIF